MKYTCAYFFEDTSLRALAEASRDGNLTRMQTLIDQGVDVNGTGTHGVTPLIFAVGQEQLSAVECLLRAGADPNLQAEGVISPLTLAVRKATDDTRVVSLLLDFGADPDLGNAKAAVPGETPLLRAIRNENLKLSLLLMDRGADLSKSDKFGVPPLLEAIEIPEHRVAYEILRRGCDPLITGKHESDIFAYLDMTVDNPDDPAEQYWRKRVKAFLTSQGFNVEEEMALRNAQRPDLDDPAALRSVIEDLLIREEAANTKE